MYKIIELLNDKINENKNIIDDIIFIPIEPNICMPIKNDMLNLKTLSIVIKNGLIDDVSLFAYPVIKNIEPFHYDIKLQNVDKNTFERIYQFIISKFATE